VIKLLKHATALEPIYIALSDDIRFYVLYGNTLLGAHNSIAAAVISVANDCMFGISRDINKWERLPVEDQTLAIKK
jgi:hypothetical protein